MKKIFIYLFAFFALMFSGSAYAIGVAATNTSAPVANIANYSEEELVALIAKLQKQLTEVRQNKVQCVLAEMDLSVGDGEDDGLKEHVKNLQYFLKEKGYLKSSATGYFGKLTRTALMNFQRDNGLTVTGELDTSVRTAVKNLKCRKDYLMKTVDQKTTSVKEAVKEVSSVSSINLTGNGNVLTWTPTGYSKTGFKITWSKNPNPTYPNRDGDKYQYLSDPSAVSTTLEAFSGSGTYYARVCEHLNGGCGTYSNEVALSL